VRLACVRTWLAFLRGKRMPPKTKQIFSKEIGKTETSV
jgi:hypothetical protein